MADTKISAAADPGALAATDKVPLARAGNAAAYAASMAEVRAFAAPYVVQGFAAGVLTASQIISVHTFAAPVTFPANFGATTVGAGSAARSLVNATASTVLTLEKCLAAADPTSGASWTAAGTVTFGAGSHAATLATTGGTALTVAAGDMLRVVAPASADSTLAGVFVALAGDRT